MLSKFSRILLLTVSLVCVVVTHAVADRYYMDHYYVAPPVVEEDEAVKAALENRYPLPEPTVRAWLGMFMPAVTLPDFVSLKQLAAEAPSHYVAVGRRIDMEAAQIFDAAKLFDGEGLYLASVTSPGAFGVRLQVDLMGLRGGERLWLLDAKGDAVFGPYTADSALAGGQWLPPTIGDSVVLALQSNDGALPLMTVNYVSHFYKPLVEKQLPCNIPIAQDAVTTVQEVSAGVGRLLVAYQSGGQGLCTATLLNSYQTRGGVPKPYLLSAWHCFGDRVDYESLTIYWDYRREDADGGDAPNIYQLPFNRGADLIAYNVVLDSTLVELNGAVPNGAYGRAWAGWDSQPPALGAPVQVIHHPMGADMKTSRGRITDPEVDVAMGMLGSFRYEKQIEAVWSAGVTEQGSSGSALLLRNDSYRISGVLSNGTMHSCTDTSNNLDNFGPFHVFFPQIGCHLVSGYTCQDPYEPETSGCFLLRKMGLSAETLHHLRMFRDQTLAKTALGSKLTQDYYTLAPSLENWVDNSVVLRVALEALTTVGAAWGSAL